MKKNLRLLCLSLFTASLMTGFAQENVTEKLNNTNFEKGVAFWDVEYENQIWSVNRNKAKQTGFYGFSGINLEVWRDGSVLMPNSISQTVSNLPNGTYVFGAYVGASRHLATPAQPTKAEGVSDAEYKASEEYKKWKAEYDAIRAKFVADSVFGVKMFANLDEIPVATEHPDRGEEKRHTVKFNIATKVTDGNLTVGLDVDSTNTIYVCWDEVELYYFGDMDAAAALDAMAKIDAKKPLAIADTVINKHMAADTLKFLNEGIAAVNAVATAADFTAADEKLRWGVVLANRSANDYTKLAKKIAASNELVNSKNDWYYPEDLAATQAVIAYAQGLYDGKTANRTLINETIDSLTLSCALLQRDNLELAAEELTGFINANAAKFGDAVGDYPVMWKDSLERLSARVAKVLSTFSAETAIEDIKLIDVIEQSIQACVNSVIVEHEGTLTAIPLVTLTEADGTIATKKDKMYSFRSKNYTVAEGLAGLRFTVTEDHWDAGNKHVQDDAGYTTFALSEVYVFDGEGNQIKLSESNVSSNATHVTLNPQAPWDATAVPANLVDGDAATYFHSSYGVSPNEAHYVEITLPGGVDLKEFAFGWDSRSTQEQGIPKTVEVSIMTYVSEAKSALISSIASAKELMASTTVGTGVGYYAVDLTALNAALESAEALIAAGAGESECQTAWVALDDAMDAVRNVPMNLPVAGKEYRVISAGAFFATQGIHKALTAYSDSTVTNRIWWETAGKDSLDQVFTFKPIANEEGKLYFMMQNKLTGLFVGEWYNESGERGDRVALYDLPDTIELVGLGAGQIALHDGEGRLHCGDHNSGSVGNPGGAFGGNRGVASGVVHWGDGLNSASAWYICEMSELPLTALVEGATYTSPMYYLYETVNVVAFTANKETAFENFAVRGVDGQIIEAELDQMGATILATLPEGVWAFSFSFDNKEGVTEVVVGPSKLGELRAAYDAAVALAPEEGEGVAQYRDLKDYHAALAAAEDYFKKGATDEQVEAAVAAINAAVKALAPNKPAADKVYYIMSALEGYEKNHNVPMAIYAKQTKNAEGVDVSYARWTYLSTKSNYHWRFIEAETRKASSETEADTVFYNIQNVTTGEYMKSVAQSTALELTDSVELAGKYAITILQGTIVNINLNNKIDEHKCLHAGEHYEGTGKGGNIVGYAGSVNTASSWYISEVEAVLTDLDFTVVDDNDEEVTPVVKGIYDLYGRRVVNPTAPGIYIVDGMKRVIK